jgi:KAP family P-loop domain
MTPDEIHDLQRYIARCDPEQPLMPDNVALYEPLDKGEPVRGSGGLSCIEELAQTIRLREPTGATCQLFTGFQGSGKTTELRRLATRLQADKVVPTHVVFVDFEKYIDIYTPISITDVLRVLAYALDREATAEKAIKEGKDPDKVEIGYLRRLFDFVARLDPQIKSIGYDVYGAKLMLEIKDNPDFRQRVEDALKLRFQAFAQEATDMMSEAIIRLRAATGAQRIVVVADGLEKLTYVRDAKVESAAETVFVTHASWLRLPVHVIYTFPFWLRFRASALGALYHREPRILPMVKIAERGGGTYAEGVQKLVRLVGRRVTLDRVFGADLEHTLHPIIEASGGYPRDLLRMIRDLLSSTPSLPVTPAGAQRIVGELAQVYARVIRTPDVDILVEIARRHALPMGDGDRLAAFSRLFSRQLVLAYMNGEEWYDLHPLARLAPEVKERLAAAR